MANHAAPTGSTTGTSKPTTLPIGQSVTDADSAHMVFDGYRNTLNAAMDHLSTLAKILGPDIVEVLRENGLDHPVGKMASITRRTSAKMASKEFTEYMESAATDISIAVLHLSAAYTILEVDVFAPVAAAKAARASGNSRTLNI